MWRFLKQPWKISLRLLHSILLMNFFNGQWNEFVITFQFIILVHYR
jgi:hypothetical protein